MNDNEISKLNAASFEHKAVKKMQRVHSQSKPNLLCNLEINESIADVIKLDFDSCKVEDINAYLAKMRSAIGNSVANARERSGYDFVTQSLVAFTTGYDIAISMIVTRIK